MRARLTSLGIALALAGGCRGVLNPAYCAAHPTDDRCVAANPDGALADGDGSTGGPDAPPVCIGSDVYQVCLPAAPTTPTTITDNIQTGGVVCLDDQPIGWTANQPAACFVVGTDLTVSAAINARGPRPLVLVASGTLTISGSIDASAKHGSMVNPAGYVAAQCTAGAAATSSTSGAGGGAGGTFGTIGGGGGSGDAGVFQAGTAAALGNAPTMLHGGCGGETGGTGNDTTIGLGGYGGGVVYLVAGTAIVFSDNASINASGAGGTGGGHVGGGGGGGSGGMIVLWAPTITVGNTVSIFANGGGGAGGGGVASDGNSGGDPASAVAPGTSGNGVGGAGNGGLGGYGSTDAAPGAQAGAGTGGGGGGGATGYVFTSASLAPATVSPPASAL